MTGMTNGAERPNEEIRPFRIEIRMGVAVPPRDRDIPVVVVERVG